MNLSNAGVTHDKQGSGPSTEQPGTAFAREVGQLKERTMLKTAPTAKRGHPMMIGLKALGLIAVAWGAVYPALLWGLGTVLP